MKQSIQTLPFAMLLAARAMAQTTTTPMSTTTSMSATTSPTVTSFFSVCPTASSTTITVSTTTTICPGPNCGGTTTIFYEAQPITTVGADGRTTVYEDWTYTAACPCAGGVCDATYTITRGCPCTEAPQPTEIPSGFTTAEIPCHACAMSGGPSTVTVTTPVPGGCYASQTPVMGTPYNGVYASAAASAYASAGPYGAVASAGSNAVAAVGNNYVAGNANTNANANADANANANADASANTYNSVNGMNSSAVVSSNTNANANNGTAQTAPITGVYKGSANRLVYAVSAVAAGLIGSLALFL